MRTCSSAGIFINGRFPIVLRSVARSLASPVKRAFHQYVRRYQSVITRLARDRQFQRIQPYPPPRQATRRAIHQRTVTSKATPRIFGNPIHDFTLPNTHCAFPSITFVVGFIEKLPTPQQTCPVTAAAIRRYCSPRRRPPPCECRNRSKYQCGDALRAAYPASANKKTGRRSLVHGHQQDHPVCP